MLHEERILTLAEATKVLPSINGRRPHVSTIWRWARKGIQGVKLETRRIGGRFVTSAEALDRFTATLAELQPLCREPREGLRARIPDAAVPASSPAQSTLDDRVQLANRRIEAVRENQRAVRPRR